MSYDLTIWKWRPDAQSRDVAEVLQYLERDEAHPALQLFDAAGFHNRLVSEFHLTEGDDDPFTVLIAQFTGVPANWIGLSVWFSQVDAVVPRIKALAREHGLFVMDYQDEKS